MKRPMPRFLWITDPWKELTHAEDTSLRLAQECLAQKIPTYWCDFRSIRIENKKVLLDASAFKAVKPGRRSQDFIFEKSKAVEPAGFERIFFRTDPPVDLGYLHPLQLLDLATRDEKNCEIISPAKLLFASNEKLEALRLGPLCPPSVVSSNWEVLSKFGTKEGQTVLKPLHQAQSKGVSLIDWSPKNQNANQKLLAAMTLDFTVPVILQRYLKEILQGEIRLWFLNGDLLASAKKLPKKGQFKIDMDAGGTLGTVTLTRRQTQIATQIGRHLKSLKIRMAAIDLIADQVTDFNFTSPGLLVQMESLLSRNLAQPIVKSLVRPWE